VPLATLIDVASGARIVHAFCGNTAQQVLLATNAGYGFTCVIGDMVGRNKAGKQFITVDDAAVVLNPVLFTASTQSWVAAVSRSGRLLVFTLAELKNLPSGGKGVILLGLAEHDEMTGAIVINRLSVKITVSSGSREQQIKLEGAILESYFGKRARGGKSLPTKGSSAVITIEKLN
jgi:topoisomerase-4 subunit A